MRRLVVTIEGGRVVPLSRSKGEAAEQHVIPLDLDALTIGQAQALCEFLAQNAEEAYLRALMGYELPTSQQWSSKLKERYAMLCAAIAAILHIDRKYFDALTFAGQREIAEPFEAGVLLPLYRIGAYRPEPLTQFEFGGTTYCLPTMQGDGFGGMLPMARASAEEWCEANDLQLAIAESAENPYKALPLLVAIIARPEGEAYDELRARERAGAFKDLPLGVGLAVFFTYTGRMFTLLGYIGGYLAQLAARDKATKDKGSAASERRGATSSIFAPKTHTVS